MIIAVLSLATLVVEPWHLETTAGPRFRVVDEVTRDSKEPVTAWEAVAARPPDLDEQRTTKHELYVDGRLVARPDAVEDSPAHVPVMAAVFTREETGHGDPVSVSAVYEGQMYRVRLVPGPSPKAVPQLSEKERSLCLAETKDIDFRSAAVQQYIEKNGLRRGKDEGVVDFGRRVYRNVRQSMKYKVDAPFDGRPCSDDLKTMVGHCGNYSRLAVAVFRANGIPARVQFGHWLTKSGTFEGGQPHTRAHFWAPGVGWVLCDTSIAVRPGGWKPERDLDIGFGSTRTDFLAYHVHGWLQVPTRHWGPQLQTHLQGIYLPALGGTWEHATYRHVMTVELKPAE